MKTGVVVKNKEEYTEAIELLYKDVSLRTLLSQNAMKFADEFFSLKKMANSWEETFERLMKQDKSTKYWFDDNNELISPSTVFFESLGLAATPFIDFLKSESDNVASTHFQVLSQLGKKPQWQSKSKGTVHHYCHYFPDDKQLAKFSDIMNFYSN